MTDPENVLSVTQLTRDIREALEGQIGSVWVEGEISNHRMQSSGHQYFTLKDAGAQLSCVMFRGSLRQGVRMTEGAQVQLYGAISVYEARGQYQMVVKHAQMKGQGSLQARFEALKRRLYEEGLFDAESKTTIPKYPHVVALVTSPTGAAIQDMLNILTRRAPWIHVLVYPVRVQGQGVEAETIHALEILNDARKHGLPEPDTIVIGRGGGSIEDLWAYNEESLARAIYASRIPVISAVGHEIDFTIADFVADLRAPTPSAAAELLAPEGAELRRHFESISRRLDSQMDNLLTRHEQTLDFMARGVLKGEPDRQLQAAAQETDDLEYRLKDAAREKLRMHTDALVERQQVLTAHHPRILLSEAEHRMEQQAQMMKQGLLHRLARLEDRVKARADVMRNLGPGSVLARGFSYTTDPSGKVIRSASDVASGQVLITRLEKGEVKSVAE